MKVFLQSVGAIGFLLFGILLGMTFAIPNTIEKAGQQFIRYQVEKEVEKKLGSLSSGGFEKKARFLAGKYKKDIDSTLQSLQQGLPEKIASVIAKLCGWDCEKKKQLSQSIEEGYLDKIKSYSGAKDVLARLIRGKYLEIVANLTLDVRIFLASNAFLFGHVALVSYLKPQSFRHLILTSTLLLLATFVSSMLYLFGQDWFFTIIYNEYMGWGYLGYVCVIFGFFLDILLNRARVTTKILNGILNAFGSALSVVPC